VRQPSLWPGALGGSREPADADLRARWRDLVERQLPQAARSRPDWPVRLDHCFARILLDNALGRPWREVVAPPAWRNTPGDRLATALALGEAALAGVADLSALIRRALRLRRDGSGRAAPGSAVKARPSPPAPFPERKGRDRDP